MGRLHSYAALLALSTLGPIEIGAAQSYRTDAANAGAASHEALAWIDDYAGADSGAIEHSGSVGYDSDPYADSGGSDCAGSGCSRCGCGASDFAGCCCGPRYWLSAEYLLWWTNGVHLPPLITTSPAGTPVGDAAILDGPSTQVLFGDETVNDEERNGFRIRGGQWLDPCREYGYEASFLWLEGDSDGLTAASDGSQIIGRPFFNVQTGEGAAELVSFPGVVSGTVTASASTSDLVGADFGLRRNIWCTRCDRLDWTAGYRFFYFADEVRVTESLNPQGPVVPGTQIDLFDSFNARNQFHGAYLGLIASRNRGPWTIEAMGRLDVGAVLREVSIAGSTNVSVPGFGSVTSPGGLLALSSNIGSDHSSEAVVIPEFEIRAKYRLTNQWQVFAGYSLIYWSEVARAGDQIDLAVNPDLLPPPISPPSGPLRPRFALDRSDLVIQGLSIGTEWSF